MKQTTTITRIFMHKLWLFLPVFAHLCVSACALNVTHSELLAPADKSRSIQSVLIVPADITVLEFFPGVVEEVPLWSQEVNEITNSGLAALLETDIKVRVIHLHQSKEDYPEAIVSHLDLLENIQSEVSKHTQGEEVWRHKINHFDYSIGPGLGFLKKRGVDALMFVSGVQLVRNLNNSLNAPSVYFADRKNVELAKTILRFVLVDIESGDLLWVVNVDTSGVDMRSPMETDGVLRKALVNWPFNHGTSVKTGAGKL